MNHASTKALVEFLHAYLNFLNNYLERDVVTMEANKGGVEFACEQISNPHSQRDILTQSSIIFWMLARLRRELKIDDLIALFKTTP